MLAKLRNRRTDQSSAFSIVEVMIAAVIIMIILVATGVGLSQAFRNSAYVENQTKAEQLLQDVLAQVEQAPYRQVFLPNPDTLISDAPDLFGNGRCSANYSNTPSGTQFIEASTQAGIDPYPGLVYCRAHRFANPGAETGVGTTFFIETSISWVTSNAGLGNGTESDPSMFPGANNQYLVRRIEVTVRWQDVVSGDEDWHTVTASSFRTPTTAECLPAPIPLDPNLTVPGGCAP